MILHIATYYNSNAEMKFSKTLSQIYRGKWFIRPDDALSLIQDEGIRNLMLGKLASEDSFEFERKPLPIMIVSANDEKMMLENNIFDHAPKGSTAIIPLKGTMMKYSTMCSYGCEEIAEQISLASNHKNISEIVLDIDSGGGAVDAVAPLVKSINESRKTIIASADLCCSAAQWTASACKRTVANNNISAEFGSIGVMMSFWDVKPYYEKMGYKFHEIYSNESTYKNEAFRKAMEGEYDLIKEEELDPLARKFQATIRQYRGSKLVESDPGILKGKTFYADYALKYGLIDHIGTIETAVEIARKISRDAMINQYVKQ